MPTEKPSFWMTPSGPAALGLVGAVAYYRLMEHRQHLFAALPFLIIPVWIYIYGRRGLGGITDAGRDP